MRVRASLQRLLREEHGWGKVWTGLAIAVALAGGGLVYQRTTVPPAPPAGCALPAYPDASCTGVPVGITLTPSGPITVTVAGTIIDARDVTGQIVVNAANVTIRNTRVRSNAFRAIESNSTGLLIEDSDIGNLTGGEFNCHNGVGSANFTVRRTVITGCENGIDIGSNLTIEDSYIHSLDTVGPSYVWGNSPHTDGIQASGNNLTIRHNTIDPVVSGGGTSAIILNTETVNSNITIEDNYLDGRNTSYAVYAPRLASTNIFINRNRMWKGFGYTACVRLGVTVTEFTDNRDAGTLAVLPPDEGGDGGCSN